MHCDYQDYSYIVGLNSQEIDILLSLLKLDRGIENSGQGR